MSGMSKRISRPFLLGALYARMTINQADHLLHGIRAQFPETKGWVPKMLQRQFGGSIFVKRNRLGTSICYVLKSKEGLSRLRRVLQRYYRNLPELAPFMALFKEKDVLRVPGITGMRFRKKMGATPKSA